MRIIALQSVKYDPSLSIATVEFRREQAGYFRTWADQRKFLYVELDDDATHYYIMNYAKFRVRCPESAVSEMSLRWGDK